MRGLAWLAPLTALAPLALLGSSVADAQDAAPVADLVRIHKAQRRMVLWSDGRPLRVIENVQFGWQPLGPKRFEGDGRTPEGRYEIDWSNPDSQFHLSLHISYPDAQDRAYAAARGRSAGGMIMIHGQPNGLAGAAGGARVPGDWTNGCIALANDEMEYVWRTVPDRTPVEILP